MHKQVRQQLTNNPRHRITVQTQIRSRLQTNLAVTVTRTTQKSTHPVNRAKQRTANNGSHVRRQVPVQRYQSRDRTH